MDPTWAAVATGVAAIVGVLVVVVPLVGWALRIARKFGHLVDDLAGEPARAGAPARPSLMERVAVVEARTVELLPNGGGSIKDQIGRMDNRLAAVERCLGGEAGQ